VLTRAIRLKSSSCWEIVLEGVKVMDLGAGFIEMLGVVVSMTNSKLTKLIF